MESTAPQRLLIPLLFILAGAFVIFIVQRAQLGLSAETLGYLQAWQYALLALLVGALIVGIIRRSHSRHLAEAFFTATVFLGIWFAFLHVIPLWSALLAASFLTLTQLLVRRVALHDLFYLLGCSGVALNIALWLPSEVLVFGLAAFTLYDMVAGSPGGPIVELAQKLTRFAIIPGFVLPARPQDFLRSVDAVIKTPAVLLGAGDVILPLTLVARAAFVDTNYALIVLLGTVVGACVLVRRTDLHPRSALLPLAAGASIPFILVPFLL